MTNLVAKSSKPVVQGRSEGPVRAGCEVLVHRSMGVYQQLTLVAPEIATRTSAGQFVSLGVGGGSTVLRRPFSVAGVSQRGPWAGTIDVVYSVVGAGTEWLAKRDKHDIIDVVGPLGRAFPLPKQKVNCLLVAGGYGAAPLLYLGRQLQREGLRVDFALGAASQDRMFNAIEVKRMATSAVFTTDDGSFGTAGRVTDVVPAMIAAGNTGVIYGCGPMAMLSSLSRVAVEHDVACQVAVEESMACGVGVCMTCVVPMRRRDGLANVRACLEGPVLDAKRIDWAARATSQMSGTPKPLGDVAGDAI